LPPYVKINPDSPPGLAEGIQPGDLSMGAVAAEFLEMDEDEDQWDLQERVPASVVRGGRGEQAWLPIRALSEPPYGFVSLG